LRMAGESCKVEISLLTASSSCLSMMFRQELLLTTLDSKLLTGWQLREQVPHPVLTSHHSHCPCRFNQPSSRVTCSLTGRLTSLNHSRPLDHCIHYCLMPWWAGSYSVVTLVCLLCDWLVDRACRSGQACDFSWLSGDIVWKGPSTFCHLTLE
jgi:hypothetical protein